MARYFRLRSIADPVSLSITDYSVFIDERASLSYEGSLGRASGTWIDLDDPPAKTGSHELPLTIDLKASSTKGKIGQVSSWNM